MGQPLRISENTVGRVKGGARLVEVEQFCKAGERKLGGVIQEAKWEAMGSCSGLANPVAAAAERWAPQGCEQWKGLS